MYSFFNDFKYSEILFWKEYEEKKLHIVFFLTISKFEVKGTKNKSHIIGILFPLCGVGKN